MGETRQIAEWLASFGASSDRLPDSVRDVVKHAVLDTVSCGLYGRKLEWSQHARRWAERGSCMRSGPGSACIWGTATPRLRPSEAAFVNGVAAHAFELDDYHPVKVHPGAVVVPAVLAVGEARGCSGALLLRAVAAGYEVMIRTSAALEPTSARLRGWHLTGVTGPLGAAAAVSVLLGFDAERTAWALGLAGTQAGGLFAFTADGSMSKRFHAGEAARAGVVAAELAEEGFTGPTAVYEANDGGYLDAFGDKPNAACLVDGLGEHWSLLGTAFKPYACCGSLHAYVDAALELREVVSDDTRIRIGLPKVVDVQCGFDYEIGSVLSAQMNARFCVATALRFGRVLPEEFGSQHLIDVETLALMSRIEQEHAPELDDVYPAHFCGWVEVEEPGGDTRRAYRHDPSGAAVNPHKPEAMVNKCRLLLNDDRVNSPRELETVILGLEQHDADKVASAMVSIGVG